MPRLLLVTNYGRSLPEMRGALIAALHAAGYQVTVCAPPDDPEAPARLASLGAGFVSLPGDRTGINPLADLDYLRRILALYGELRPDRVLAFSSKPVIYCGLAARMRGHRHTYGILTGLGYVYTGTSLRQRMLALPASALYRVALPGVRRVVFQNEDDLRFFAERGLLRDRARGVVVPGDGVDLAHFAPEPLPMQGHFLLIARMLRDKGVVEYFDAASRVRARHPEARFRLVGWFDSNPAALTESEARDWLARGDVEFLGFSQDVREPLRDTDVYVLPSHREGMPRTTIEAMAMGRPVITTDAPGCRVTVDGNGWRVPAGDAAALAEAIERALAARPDWPRLGARSRELAEQRFGTQVVNRQLLEAMDCG